MGVPVPTTLRVTSRPMWLELSDPSERRHEASKEGWARVVLMMCFGGPMHRPPEFSVSFHLSCASLAPVTIIRSSDSDFLLSGISVTWIISQIPLELVFFL